jgi:hypothetical protein
MIPTKFSDNYVVTSSSQFSLRDMEMLLSEKSLLCVSEIEV